MPIPTSISSICPGPCCSTRSTAGPGSAASWLQPAVEVNPVSVVVTSVRELMAGSFQAGSVATVLLYCVVLVAVFGPISMFIYNRKS